MFCKRRPKMKRRSKKNKHTPHLALCPSASRSKLAVIALGGFAAGLLNGLLGAGGGIAAVAALSFAVGEDEESRKSVYANALVLMALLSLLTLTGYVLGGKAPKDFLSDGYAPTLAAASVGGILGALLTDKLRSKALKKLFAALTILSGVLLLVG